jgi:hypothetical protein
MSRRLAKIKGENDIKEYLRIMKINNWTKWSQDGFQGKEVVEKAQTSKR